LESSFIGSFRQRVVKSIGRCAAVAALGAILTTWSGRAVAQSPDYTHAAANFLPRFTLREILAGRNDSLFRIPGPWIRAATVSRPDSSTLLAYIESASRSGMEPLAGNTLTSQRSQHVMGLYRRDELVDAIHRTLESIRAAIPSDSTRARFDRLFRSRGAWVVDLHEAALVWARSRAPGIDWGSARPALLTAGWLPPGDSAGTEAVPRALYGLCVLAANDSVAFAEAESDMRRINPSSAEAVSLLLRGYRESRAWYAEALNFFLIEPWVGHAGDARSIGDLVQDYWSPMNPSFDGRPPVAPQIQTRFFGYPQAVPHYGVPELLFDRLFQAENELAKQWLDRNGSIPLLQALRWLPPGDTSLALVDFGHETVRLSTVPRQARESLNGFLEPTDLIAIDPGYSPLLALGAVVHEWQHLAFRRLQLEQLAVSLRGSPLAIVRLPGVQPYVAEGFAEWSAEQILAPIVSRWPLLGLGELEKRAGLARENPDDQHPLGYALVRELAAVLKNPALTTRTLLLHAEDPSQIDKDPRLRAAWSRYRGARDYVFAAATRRVLIPEVTFTIQDGYPDVIATRILVPPDRKAVR
jgi:hypothetical protein